MIYYDLRIQMQKRFKGVTEIVLFSVKYFTCAEVFIDNIMTCAFFLNDIWKYLIFL